MNRGVSRRPIFETEADQRFFLSLVAREVRAGRIELHGFSLMLNHFHLLLRSVRGELSDSMRRIQSRYSRRFNRERGRTGPLFENRFRSKPIDTLGYRRKVLTYIHDNPVDAGVVADPPADTGSSAWHLVRTVRPRWLATDWVDPELAARGGAGCRAEQLAAAFPCRIDPEFRSWVAKQLRMRRPDEVEDVSLRYAGSAKVLEWAMSRSRLADGTPARQYLCPPNSIEAVLARAADSLLRQLARFGRKATTIWDRLRAGLLRRFAGCTHREIGLRLGRHSTTICRDLFDHQQLLEKPTYAQLVSKIGHLALATVR